MSFHHTARLLALVGCVTLAGCGGGDRYTPAAEQPGSGVAPRVKDAQATQARRRSTVNDTPKGEGLLDVATASGIVSYLGSLHAVVTDAGGNVVGGADEERTNDATAAQRELSIVLPAGSDYTLSLSASTADATPTTCHATVGGLQVADGTVGRVQVLGWSCGDAFGYVPQDEESSCFWLADWTFVSRSSAAVGELIDVSASGHDAQGNLARFAWSTALPHAGDFAEPSAASTAFQCRAAGEALPLTVTISDGECQKRLTQNITCL